jgi:hypothetical protein
MIWIAHFRECSRVDERDVIRTPSTPSRVPHRIDLAHNWQDAWVLERIYACGNAG